jgi:hypothetical protein
MGNCSILKIGRLVFEWKFPIPTFVFLLFEANDFYSKPRKLKYEDDWYEEIGYSTTCGKSLDVLNRFGYNIDFFAEVYDTFHSDLEESFIYAVRMEIAKEVNYELSERQIHKAVREHLKKYPSQSRADDLRDFVRFLKEAISSNFEIKAFSKPVTVNVQGGKSLSIPARDYIQWRQMDLADFMALQMYFFDKAKLFPPSVIKVSQLFDFEERYGFDYPEIILLMYTRLVLEATPKNRKITLDLSDITESAEEVKLMHSELAISLTKKVHLYNRVFKVLSEHEEDVRERYVKTKTRSLLGQLSRTRRKDLKGKLLEEMISIIFEGHPGVEIVERRYSTGDEEIDLIIKNNLSKPFWLGLSSPMIFVECKNWHKPVGTKELRDFEIKLQNHRPLVRVGFFVAPGGFSRECLTELRRASRDDYTIVLIDMKALYQFVNSSLSVPNWLEEKICHPI